MFLQACNYSTVKVLSGKNENLFKHKKEDTIVLKSLSVIDRYKLVGSVFRKPKTVLVKNVEPTKGKPEDAFYEIKDSSRYEYSYPFVLRTIENLVAIKEFPVLFDKKFSYINDSLFKTLLNDSLFNKGFDTIYAKKISVNVEDGVHLIVTVLRSFNSGISEAGHTVWLNFYFEFFDIKENTIKKYVCLKMDRNSQSPGISTLKKHRWRILDKDTRRVFEKLFKLGISKEGK